MAFEDLPVSFGGRCFERATSERNSPFSLTRGIKERERERVDGETVWQSKDRDGKERKKIGERGC